MSRNNARYRPICKLGLDNFDEIMNSVPDLLSHQKHGYNNFLQIDTPNELRKNHGLHGIFSKSFPVKGRTTTNSFILEYAGYEIRDPMCTVAQAYRRRMSYTAPLYVKFKLSTWDLQGKVCTSIVEENICFGNLPIKTATGTFIFNGVERTIVSQLHRSPGMFFEYSRSKEADDYSGFTGRIVPHKGAWVDLEADAKDILYIRVDRKRKFLASTLLLALDNDDTWEKRQSQTLDPRTAQGFSKEYLLAQFYQSFKCVKENNKWKIEFRPYMWKNIPLPCNLYKLDGSLFAEQGTKISDETTDYVYADDAALCNLFLATNVTDSNDIVLAEASTRITPEILINQKEINIVEIRDHDPGAAFCITLSIDKCVTQNDAVAEIVKALRPGESLPAHTAESFVRELFFNINKYDLSNTGRTKLNARTNANHSVQTLCREDLIATVRILLDLRRGNESFDDIDSLDNRRVRLVDELLEAHCRQSIIKMANSAKERISSLSSSDNDKAMPSSILHTKPFIISVKDFFGSSELSQLMDQANVLSSVSHQRRSSAMGQGGVIKDYASLEIRDIHPTHYGKICAIETPEGPSVGLVVSLAVHSHVNNHGFLETQYRIVKDGKITDQKVFCTTAHERNKIIADFTALRDGDTLLGPVVTCRLNGNIIRVSPDKVHLMDISPFQPISIAASMIPFVEHNDPARALMGANMQRQALPLLCPEAPLLCTGTENIVATDSEVVIRAKNSGKIKYLDHSVIIIAPDDNTKQYDVYELTRYSKSNASTCISQRPVDRLKLGCDVIAGEIIADATSTDHGDVALGKNVTVAFMPWYGYNFEDAAVVSDRLVNEDIFTSVHIDHFDALAHGEETFTRDIPNVAPELLSNLDENGIVRIGSEVKPGDLLVGKVAPRADSDIIPEEKLLRSIFGDKATDVYDLSLKVPPGVTGIVTDVQILCRRGYMTETEIEECVKKEQEEFITIHNIRMKFWVDRVKRLLPINAKITKNVNAHLDNSLLNWDALQNLDIYELLRLPIKDSEGMLDKFRDELEQIQSSHTHRLNEITRAYKASSDELLPTVSKSVRVFITSKRRIQAGDKIAGRHGNKCVVSVVVPQSDMPHLADGTPVDIILNVLGVPSRMNIGQIYEVIAGMASDRLAKKLGKLLERQKSTEVLQLMSQIFEKDANNWDEQKTLEYAKYCAQHGVPILAMPFCSPTLEQLEKLLELADVDKSCQFDLYDGKTGDKFNNKITVGKMYIARLNHDVDDKLHARSIGQYALLSQQPLSGKSQFGGQRVGEMEVWALQASGAAYTLLEVLTIKSDDIQGRLQAFDAIVRGDDRFSANIPESFKTFCLYLRSLGLNISYKDDPQANIIPGISDYSLSTKLSDIDIKFNLASPDDILSWSYGEIESAETNYHRNDKPVHKGLFCARTFGPVHNYECVCGKYKRMKYKGIVCEKCYVEVTHSKVRRERMGHINLATAVTHVWFTYVLPSRIGALLDMSLRTLESIIGCESYVITNPGETSHTYGQIISAKEYDELERSLADETGDLSVLTLSAQTGGEAIETLLKTIHLDEEEIALRQELKECTSDAKGKKIAKKLELVHSLIKSNTRPEWMTMRVVPVLPAGMRPIATIDNGYGRVGTIGLNELYKTLINRNERLRRLLMMKGTPDIVRHEKRCLQQAVDSLMHNGRNGSFVVDNSGNKLKSLANAFTGKTGILRKDSLGKRTDYSGRSVIVVGPELKLDQCAIPRKMALELFKPHVLSKLESYGFASTLKIARKLVEKESPEVWDILNEVIKDRPVLLNRAPTLHRLGIQAFNPILTHGKAIRIHPLVCAAFNADFDGDQMSVHVPLSVEARLEAHHILLSTQNLLSPGNGKPVITPSQDIVLGMYELTYTYDHAPVVDKLFASTNEVQALIINEKLDIHSKIKLLHKDEIIETTPGRVLMYSIMPENTPFNIVNRTFKKKDLGSLLNNVYKKHGNKIMAKLADDIKDLGFYWATKGGISLGKDDFIQLTTLDKHLVKTNSLVASYEEQHRKGFIIGSELNSKTIDAWTECIENVSNDLMKEISISNKKGLNPLYVMLDSNARGSKSQLTQMLGARGLVTRLKNNEIVKDAVATNYHIGLTPHDFIISAYGTRKGCTDTALKTSSAGYLTRKLVAACQSCVITELDCGTQEGIKVVAAIDPVTSEHDISSSIFGRVLSADICCPKTGEVVIPTGTLIQEDECDIVKQTGVHHAFVRSAVKCQSTTGMCAKCYGLDLAKRTLVNLGEAVGIVAAQSIGEPGAQLTMNTFHSGGVAQRASTKSAVTTTAACVVSFDGKYILNELNDKIVISRNTELILSNDANVEIARHRIPYGAKLLYANNERVDADTTIAQWDGYNTPVITERSGEVVWHDLVEGISFQKEVDELTGITSVTVIDWKHHAARSFQPRIDIVSKENNTTKISTFTLSPGAVLEVNNHQHVNQGQILAKIPKESLVSKDITGGLPRVSDLLEARYNVKNQAILADIDGYIEQEDDRKSKRKIIISVGEQKVEYVIPHNRAVIVRAGDFVRKGDQLTDGELSPHCILRILGIDAVTEYLIREIQEVYQMQGATINNKHLEIVVRQMLRKSHVIDAGDSDVPIDTYIEEVELQQKNKELLAAGLRPIIANIALMGITNSVMHGSYLSSISFQNSIRTFITASLNGTASKVESPQDCVVVATLMRAGTGFACRALNKQAIEETRAG